jgi:hypothetical protein
LATDMLKKYLLASALLLMALWSPSCGDSENQKQARAPEPLDLELRLVPTAEQGRTVAVLRFFSRALNQRLLDQRLLPEDKRETIEPLRIEAGPGLWIESLTFQVLNQDGKAVELKPGEDGKVEALRFPKVEELSLGPGIVAQAVYLLDSPQDLSQGSKVRAVLKVESRDIASPYRKIPPAPTSTAQAALQKARVARWADDTEAMLKAGQEISAHDPSSPAGPWYQGLAQERLGQNAAALKSYKKAMGLWRQKNESAKHAEPPLGLARRITRLERLNKAAD